MSPESSRIKNLLELMNVEQIDANIYRGSNPEQTRRRVFGGQVLGQALMAAGRTVEGRLPHSLHAYFLRPGRPAIPIVYTVDRIRDGGSFNTRRVVAIQDGEAIFNMSASFHKLEEGFSHQEAMPGVPPPSECPGWEELIKARSGRNGPAPPWARNRPVEMRPAIARDGFKEEIAQGEGGALQRCWIKADPMPDDPLLHLCVAAHTSDHSLLGAMRRPHGGAAGWSRKMMSASLDHVLWFHKQFRMDSWLLYHQESPVTAHARGLALGRYFTEGGELVASVCQEGLIRPVEPQKGRD